MAEPLLRVSDLVRHFRTDTGTTVRAVAGVSLEVQRGSTLAIVGESGCGKTTLARCVIGAIRPTTGTIAFAGQDLTRLRGAALRTARARLGFVQQNPMSALDPTMRVRDIVAEPLRIHRPIRGQQLDERVVELLGLVSLRRAVLEQRPGELSGGQAQRVAIARAIALGPELLVLDEPTSALDLSVQAQILNLLVDLQARLSLTYVLISHDLDVVEHVSDVIAVMYLGRVVEQLEGGKLHEAARHPYTIALVSATPTVGLSGRGERIVLRGDVPDQGQDSIGCAFASRCWLRTQLDNPSDCDEREPALSHRGDAQLVACHFADRTREGSMA